MSVLIKGINIPKEPWECPCHNGENGNCNVTQKVCFEIPKDCPLVEINDDEVANGEWLEKEVFDNTDEDFVWKIDQWQSARCSVCGKYHTTPYMYYFDNFNYCPYCGARMGGEK